MRNKIAMVMVSAMVAATLMMGCGSSSSDASTEATVASTEAASTEATEEVSTEATEEVSTEAASTEAE